MRLFVAVFPDEAVNAAVDEAVAGLDGDRWRVVARERRHVTLRFHADADPHTVAADLRRGLDGPVPALRCAGAGVFGTALWLGVHPDDGSAWRRLLRSAGAEPVGHVAHLTVARCREPAAWVPPGPGEHRGPWWRPDAVALVASGSPYRVVERFGPVGPFGPPGADEAVGGPR